MGKDLSVAVVGLGYFSQFHLDAWRALGGVQLIGLADIDAGRRKWAEDRYKLLPADNLNEIAVLDPDIIDIVTPPPSHFKMIKALASKNRILICQKPFCTSVREAEEAIAYARLKKCKLLIHENFRFQPWYRTIKTFLDEGKLGQVYEARYYLRPGDGRGQDAYLNRQPAFQTMPRLMIHETGVHFIDLFQWMLGDITSAYADIRQLNPVIQGEDSGILIMHHSSGAQSILNGNRLSDHPTDNLRRTMGVMQIEGEAGTIDINGLADITFRAFGSMDVQSLPIDGEVDMDTFGGGCVKALNAHVIAAANGERPFENEGHDYLSVIKASEAAYKSAASGTKIYLESEV